MTSEATTEASPSIHVLMSRVLGDIDAVEKSRDNKQQGFKFRGIDDVMNALHPIFARHRVFAMPTVLDREMETRETKGGGSMNVAHLRVQYRFYGPNGDYVDAVVPGEAQDSADKATNKALSAAFKYVLFQVFCIPTEDNEDADATTVEAGRRTARQENAAKAALRNEIGDLARRNGWDLAELTAEFVALHGHAPAEAGTEALTAFRDTLATRAQAAPPVPPASPAASEAPQVAAAGGRTPEDVRADALAAAAAHDKNALTALLGEARKNRWHLAEVANLNGEPTKLGALLGDLIAGSAGPSGRPVEEAAG